MPIPNAGKSVEESLRSLCVAQIKPTGALAVFRGQDLRAESRKPRNDLADSAGVLHRFVYDPRWEATKGFEPVVDRRVFRCMGRLDEGMESIVG